MNILFIEDDPMNRRVVSDMLDVAGAVMTGAESAEIGLKLIDENDYNIVLLDLRMPGMDGFEALERIRGRGDGKGGTHAPDRQDALDPSLTISELQPARR